MLPVNATAVGSAAYISEGVYYIRGHFVNVPSAYLLLDQYGNNPSYRVGLEVLESIITPEDDEVLMIMLLELQTILHLVLIDLELKHNLLKD